MGSANKHTQNIIIMKTLLSYILENIDKPVVSNAIALGRITIEQVVKKHSPKWQHELMQTEWYENKQDDISFLFKYVKTNETEAINGLKDQLALS